MGGMQTRPGFIIALLLLVLIFTVPASGCTRVSPSVPVISQFSAAPDSISPGSAASLSWTVSNASTVNIDNGIGNVATRGSRSVYPGQTTLYTLTATGPGGSNTATAQVTVASASVPATPSPTIQIFTPMHIAGAPVINFFTRDPVTFNTYTLSWNVANATEVSITPGIGAVAAVGSRTVTPTKTTTYTLSAKNAYGLSQKSVTVNMIIAPGTIKE